jgi:hypothetical protein
VLTLFERAPPTVTDSTQKKLGLQIAEISVEIAGAILAAVAAYFAQRVLGARGAKPFFTKLYTAITYVVIGFIGDRIAHMPDGIIADFESGALKKLPDFSRFVDVALGDIRWPKDVRYRAVSAEFRDCALIGVNLEAAV